MGKTADKVRDQVEVIRRGTVQIVPEEELYRKLVLFFSGGPPLKVKYGADPSAPDIHLGHTVPLQKLRDFQDLGHQVIFIIGDFTALIGDPSGQSKTRKRLTPEEVKANARTYQEQVFKILDPRKTEVVYNSQWLSALKFEDIIELAGKYTVARMLERDDFSKRYREGRPISVLEFLYPLMQGYDSVHVRADVEIGGTDQTFNLLVSRDIQREYGQPPQVVLTLPLLEGTDGVQKMSKSLDNYIGVDEPPRDIYGKVMSLSDEMMWRYYDLLSRKSPVEIEEARKECEGGTNPMVWKKELAREIAGRFSSEDAAEGAAKHFEQVCQNKKNPDEMEVVEVDKKAAEDGVEIVPLLRKAGLVNSNSEARRKIKEGAVTINGKKFFEPEAKIGVKDNDILKFGKRGFRRVILK